MLVFAYGSLADPERQLILCGRTFPMGAARLPEHRLDEPPGCYRMIYPDPEHEVKGVIVEEVGEKDLRAFDAWEDEGELYQRVEVDAEYEDGRRVRVWAYHGMGQEVPKPARTEQS